ncbi:MAG: hypothetical protein K6B46_04115 [Opitutales bacterium]|nr:hypothetical protein [Opitutales bacterium]
MKRLSFKKFFLAAASFATFAGTLSAAALADTEISFDEMTISTGGDQILRGNVVLTHGKFSLETDQVTYDTVNKNAKTDGGIISNYDRLKVVSEGAFYNGGQQRLTTKSARGNVSFVYFDGADILGTRNTINLKDTNVYYGEPDRLSPSLALDSINYYADTERVRFGSPKLCIAGVPVLPLPTMTVPKFDRPPVKIWAKIGSESEAGAYLRTTTYLTLWEAFEPGLLLDFNSSAGPMIGPAFNYNVKVDEKNSVKGKFISGYINDTSHRKRSVYGDDTTGNRGFIDWFHKQEIDRIDLSASIHYWSDSAVVEDFRRELYNENQNPDSYIEAVLPAQNNIYLSALTRLHINKFRNTQERLPEIRLDYLPMAEGFLKQTAFISFASLREQDSRMLLNQHNHRNDQLVSNRFDLYYGISAPVAADDFFSFTPIAGLRETFYANTVPANGNSSASRTLGQLGFDLALTFSGTGDYQNQTWGIDGLRHVFRPILQYRYLAGLGSQDLSRIPMIDREIYLTKPSIIDISNTRAIDQLYDRHVIRLGFENLLQTRDKNYGSKNLAEFNIYQDWRDTFRPNCDNRSFSDNFIELLLTPADWICFDYAQRTDVYHFDAKAITAGVSFLDGNLWRLRLGINYLDNPDLAFYGVTTRARQYDIYFDYRVSSRLTAYVDARYDDRYSCWNDFEIGFYHRISNAWTLNYYWEYSKDIRDGSDVSVGISASLVTF